MLKGIYKLPKLTIFSGLLLALFPIMSMRFAANAADDQVKLIVGGKQAAFIVPPYVDTTGIVMAPVDFVRLLGANYTPGTDSNVTITSASGKSFSESFQHVNDRLMVPLQTTAMALGAATTWISTTQTVVLRSKLQVARIDNDSVIIATSYPVYYRTQTLQNPNRLIVDISGADLDSPPASIPADGTNVTQIRSGQLDDQTVRLVLDLSHQINYKVMSTLQTSAIKLALNTDATDATPISELPGSIYDNGAVDAANVQNPMEVPTGPNGMVPLPTLSTSTTIANATTATTKIVDVEYKSITPTVSQVIVTTDGPINASTDSYKSFLIPGPNRLAFEVNNSVITLTSAVQQAAGSLEPSSNPLFKSIRWGLVNYPQQTASRIVLDLLHPILYTVTPENLDDNSGVRYIINIQQGVSLVDRNTATNSIAGKIVIVDAGHGGKDTGAPGRSGIYEKNFTLSIAKDVRDALAAAGATPIMTRSDDTFIPLDERSQLGIDSHADYFISIHCDSSGEQNSHSGDTVYFHGNVSTCRDLAKAIANRLGQLDITVQSDGIKSDYVRFPGIGFSVLRKSPEPAVLVECGYVNDDSDATCLADPNAQEELATGIVAGLRDFVANQ